MLNEAHDAGIGRVEQRLAEALGAVRAGSASEEVRQTLEMLQQQARVARQSCNGPAMAVEDDLRNMALQMERTAACAMEACRSAGGQVDAATQQAVRSVHDEICRMRRQMVVEPQAH